MTKKILIWSVIILGLGSLLISGVMSKWAQNLSPITQYELQTPLKKVQHSAVDKVVKPFLGDSFWTVDLDQLQSNIVRIDWVYKAQVKRQWPHTLLISIEEQSPVVRWGDKGLLNKYGEIFYPLRIQNYQNLIVLIGPTAHAIRMLIKLVVFQNKFNELSWQIKSLEEEADGVWQVAFIKAPTVILDEAQWQHKLNRFILAYKKVKLPIRKFATQIDLRYSNGFVVKEHQSAGVGEKNGS
jgi:cell division protein FtsQ